MNKSERREERLEIYKKHKNGASVEQLAEEYGVPTSTILSRLITAKGEENAIASLNEFQRQFPLNVANLLKRNGLNTETDVYDAINSQRRLRGIGKITAEQISNVIGVKLSVESKDGRTTLIYGKEARTKKVRRIHGNFCGIIDGSPISGIIEGEYLPL